MFQSAIITCKKSFIIAFVLVLCIATGIAANFGMHSVEYRIVLTNEKPDLALLHTTDAQLLQMVDAAGEALPQHKPKVHP